MVKRGAWPWVAILPWGLADARMARDTVRLQMAGGHDPVQVREVEKLKASNPAGDTFKVVALEWYARQAPQWSPAHADRSLRQFERDLFSWLGARRVQEIEPLELLTTLRKVEERGAVETADRGLMLARQVWRYDVVTGRVTRCPSGAIAGQVALKVGLSRRFNCY